MAEQESAGQPDYRAIAQEVMSLNLGDLDVAELEKRLRLIEALRAVAPRLMCSDLDCGRFRCGAFDP